MSDTRTEGVWVAPLDCRHPYTPLSLILCDYTLPVVTHYSLQDVLCSEACPWFPNLCPGLLALMIGWVSGC